MTNPASTQPLLQVRNLRTHFIENEGVVEAVNGVSFAVGKGEVLGLVGESGCGKSVTALSLMRLIRHPGRIVSGEVQFSGHDLLKLTEDEMRKVRGNDMAMIFQDPMTSLNPVMNVGRQIGEALRLHTGAGRDAARKRTIELLGWVGIPDAASRADDYPHQFSGGMRQRVMMAMALSCEPKLLIADEPTTALDVTIQAQVLELVRRLQKELGMAMIMITHDLGVVAGIADRVSVMYGGRLVETGNVGEIFRRPTHPYTIGLLRSLPRIDRAGNAKLIPIEGVPPDLIDPPNACPFEPRCPYAVDRCRIENPSLRRVADEHEVACWVDVESGQWTAVSAENPDTAGLESRVGRP